MAPSQKHPLAPLATKVFTTLPSACRGNTEMEINRTEMINRETILRISAYLDLKRLSSNKFGFQNLIKIEGSSFLNHPPWELPQMPLFSPYPPILYMKVKQSSWKDARAFEEHILSHHKLPFIIITFGKLSCHMVFYSDLEVRWQ